MIANGKVLPFRTATPHADSNAVAPARPMVVLEGLQPVLDMTQQAWRALATDVLEAADDVLFRLSQDAKGAVGQAFFESMQMARQGRETILEDLRRLTRDGFERLSRGGTKVSPSELRVLDNEAVEESLAVKHVAITFLRRGLSGFYDAHQRMQVVTGDPFAEEQNPISVQAFSHAFSEAIRPFMASLDARIATIKLIEHHALDGLKHLHQRVARQLADRGVAKMLAPAVAADENEGMELWEGADLFPELVSRPSSAWQQALERVQAQQLGVDSPGSASASETAQGTVTLRADDLQRLLAQAGGSLRVGIPVQDQVASLLGVGQAPGAVVLGQQEGALLSLVTLLFDRLLHEVRAPQALKGSLEQLQAPVMRAVLSEQDLFDQAEHPARKLLNEVMAAVEGGHDLNEGQQARLTREVDGVVRRLESASTLSAEDFAAALAQFQAFTAAERKRAELLEQRLLAAETAQARLRAARSEVERVLGQRLAGLTLPAEIVQAIERDWAALMQLRWLRDDEHAEAGEASAFVGFSQTLDVLDDLLLSLAPLESLAQAHRLVGESRRQLMERLSHGLNEAGCDGLRQKRFFQAITAWQHALVKDFRQRQQTQAGEVVEPAKIASTEDPDVSVQLSVVDEPEVARDERVTLAPVESELPEAMKRGASEVISQEESLESCLATIEGLGIGSWLEIQREGEPVARRCKLAACIRLTGQYILVSRSGAKVGGFLKEELAQMLARGSLSVLNNAQAFDRALEAIIGNNRDMQTRWVSGVRPRAGAASPASLG